MTYLQSKEACTLVEFTDQMHELLMQAYGEDVTAILQQATTSHQHAPEDLFGAEEHYLSNSPQRS